MSKRKAVIINEDDNTFSSDVLEEVEYSDAHDLINHSNENNDYDDETYDDTNTLITDEPRDDTNTMETDDVTGTSTASPSSSSKRSKSEIRKPLSAWHLFIGENSKNPASIKDGKIDLAGLGVQYRNMSIEERQRLDDLAKEDKSRYLKEINNLPISDINDIDIPISSSGALYKLTSNSSLIIPLTRVKNIVKLDPDVKNISKEALVTMTKAVELFVGHLGILASRTTATRGAKTIADRDFLHLIHSNKNFEFLRLDYPLKKIVPKKIEVSKASSSSASGVDNTIRKDSISNYFQPSSSSSSSSSTITSVGVDVTASNLT